MDSTQPAFSVILALSITILIGGSITLVSGLSEMRFSPFPRLEKGQIEEHFAVAAKVWVAALCSR